MHFAVLHDHCEATSPDKDRRICEGIATDQEKIRKRASFHEDGLAFVTHQFASVRCCTSQRFSRGVTEELDEVPDIAGVLPHWGDLESIIAADHHLDPSLPHLL